MIAVNGVEIAEVGGSFHMFMETHPTQFSFLIKTDYDTFSNLETGITHRSLVDTPDMY